MAPRYRRLGISVRQGKKVKKGLLERDLIKEQTMEMETGRKKVVRLDRESPAF